MPSRSSRLPPSLIILSVLVAIQLSGRGYFRTYGLFERPRGEGEPLRKASYAIKERPVHGVVEGAANAVAEGPGAVAGGPVHVSEKPADDALAEKAAHALAVRPADAPVDLAGAQPSNRRACDLHRDEKFLVVVNLYEQMGKAERHMWMVAELAFRTNRTLVLPESTGGRLMFRGETSFDEIYDVGLLPRELRWITSKDWLACMESGAWAVETHTFSACVVCREGKNEGLMRANLGVSKRLGKQSGTVDCRNFNRFADNVAKDASTHVTLSYMTFKDPFKWHAGDGVLELHPRWHRGAQSFVKAKGPYLAIHWRTEQSTEDLVQCARDLAERVERKRRAMKLEAPVYLASDVSLDGRAMSDTIINGTDTALKALQTLVDRIGRPYTLADTLPFHEAGLVEDLHARAAIVDRMALMYATVLMGVPPGCGKRSGSAFRRAIERWRKRNGLENE